MNPFLGQHLQCDNFPLAIFGILHPVLAEFTMALSINVVENFNRIRREILYKLH
jgi:hypothetical protein